MQHKQKPGAAGIPAGGELGEDRCPGECTGSKDTMGVGKRACRYNTGLDPAPLPRFQAQGCF